jgi:hypothetical protein
MSQVQQEPRPPFPAQAQQPPGAEYEMTPRPRYKVALITGEVLTLIGGQTTAA